MQTIILVWKTDNWKLAQQRSCYLLVISQSSSDPLGKNLCEQPPTPLESASFWTPLGISVAFCGGGGYEYFLELHNVSTLLKIKGYVMSVMYNINQMPTEFHVHQLNDFFHYNYYLGRKQQYNVWQNSGKKLLITFKIKKSREAMYFIFIKYRITDSLRTADVFAVVAPLPPKKGEKRRPAR